MPHKPFKIILAIVLGVPNRAAETFPVDIIFKPRVACIDACIEGLDGIEEGAADIGDIFLGEGEVVTRLVVIAVLHIEENGEFEQDARLVNNSLAEVSFDSGVGRS